MFKVTGRVLVKETGVESLTYLWSSTMSILE